MTDWSELKRLAEAAINSGDVGYPLLIDGPGDLCRLAEYAAENPNVFLALIADNERLLTDLRELKDAKNGLSWAFGEIKIECDQLKAENELLRKDADRYRFMRIDVTRGGDSDFCIVKKFWKTPGLERILTMQDADNEIDAAMSKDK